MNRRSAILLGVFGLLAMVAALFAPVASALAAVPPTVSQPEVPDPADDMARIEKSGKLVVGTSANYPPFEFYNSNFDLDGFDIALMRELGKRLGVEVVFNDFAFNGLLDAVQLGQVDAAIAAISVTPDRMQEVDFTNLYYLGQDAALVSKQFEGDIRSATDLAGLKIGVERGTTYQSWAQQHVVDKGLTPQENLLAYDNASAMVRDLRNGTIDVALMGLLPARQAEVRSTDLKIGGTGYNQQQFAIAARKESSLIGALNRVLGEIQSDGTFAKLVTQYLNMDADEVTPDEEAAVVENKPAEPPLPTTTVTETVVVVEQPCVLGMAFVADVNLNDYNMTAPR
ncbi:MAG: amino acid ABC transporter substrate-binding protein [Anaerolineales bacterium]|nr:amino acid ABC transporter substrate-binding protein [Anaerolineales bacterium]